MKKWIAGLLITILLSTFAVSCSPKPKETKGTGTGSTSTQTEQKKTDEEGIPEGGI